VAKRYLHEVAAVRQQGSATTSGSLAKRVNQVQKRSSGFLREELPQDPAGQVDCAGKVVSLLGKPDAVTTHVMYCAGQLSSAA